MSYRSKVLWVGYAQIGMEDALCAQFGAAKYASTWVNVVSRVRDCTLCSRNNKIKVINLYRWKEKAVFCCNSSIVSIGKRLTWIQIEHLASFFESSEKAYKVKCPDKKNVFSLFAYSGTYEYTRAEPASCHCYLNSYILLKKDAVIGIKPVKN